MLLQQMLQKWSINKSELSQSLLAPKKPWYETRLGGVAHNGFSMAMMMLVTTEEYEDQEHENIFFGTIRLEMQNK